MGNNGRRFAWHLRELQVNTREVLKWRHVRCTIDEEVVQFLIDCLNEGQSENDE